MIRAMYTSATGMNAQQTVIDNTANNLANVNTTGFKRGQANFQDLIYSTERVPGSDIAQGLQVPTGIQIGHGVRVAGITKQFTPGSLVKTGNPLDVAIQGDGFLKVTLPNGEARFTRDGALRINATGTLVTSEGYQLDPSLTIPTDAIEVSIGTDGTVSARVAGSSTPTNVGTLQLTRFPNPAGLSAEGQNLFAESASSGAGTPGTPGQNGAGRIMGGFLEMSNVEVVSELVNLILAQRAYEFNTRAIRTSDNMLGETSQLIR